MRLEQMLRKHVTERLKRTPKQSVDTQRVSASGKYTYDR
jgi:hypothetical protein